MKRRTDPTSIPFPGSKRRCVERLLPLLGGGRTLVSPFCGMAALEIDVLELGRFQRAILSDASPHVVAVLSAVQRDPDAVFRGQMEAADHISGDPGRLKEIQSQIGQLAQDDPTLAGLLLGASCWTFSRLWVRVNGQGGLNASCDQRGRPPIPIGTLRRYHAVLARAEVRLASWTWMRDTPPEGATIFCDPPYLGVGGFTAYTAAGWREADAESLADCLAGLSSCRVVVCEQSPGGGPIYQERIGVRRALVTHSQPITRNVRGDQQSTPRAEVTVVAAASRRLG